eukprot:GHVR01191496.1.p1 GENE.GHVR01191496.1~~GHVR01191496.1.p1  ORF type:complete len:803 (+),score=46.04 GHVR01191496.1:1017-3425(+)
MKQKLENLKQWILLDFTLCLVVSSIASRNENVRNLHSMSTSIIMFKCCSFRHLSNYGVNAASYHADIPISERANVHRQFKDDRLQVIVATIAYGMGIDKPDIRRVLHYGMPRNLESYVQQAGRAGRDGEPSEAIIFVGGGDASKIKMMISQNHDRGFTDSQYLQRQLNLATNMERYVGSSYCRRGVILQHFGEQPSQKDDSQEIGVVSGKCYIDKDNRPHCDCCDNCCTEDVRWPPFLSDEVLSFEQAKKKGVGDPSADLSKDSRILLKAFQSLNGRHGRFGGQTILKVVAGSNATDIRNKGLSNRAEFGVGGHRSFPWWTELCRLLRVEGYLDERAVSIETTNSQQARAPNKSFTYTSTVVTEKGLSFLDNINSHVDFRATPILQPKQPVKASTQTEKKNSTEKCISAISSLTAFNDALYKKLASTRLDRARFMNVAPAAILGNRQLKQIAVLRPSSISIMQENVDGLPQVILQNHHEMFVSLVKICKEHADATAGVLMIDDVEALNQLKQQEKQKELQKEAKMEPANIAEQPSYTHIDVLGKRTAPSYAGVGPPGWLPPRVYSGAGNPIGINAISTGEVSSWAELAQLYGVKERAAIDKIYSEIWVSETDGPKVQEMRLARVWKMFDISDHALSTVERAIDTQGSCERLKPVMERLPPDFVSYDQLKLIGLRRSIMRRIPQESVDLENVVSSSNECSSPIRKRRIPGSPLSMASRLSDLKDNCPKSYICQHASSLPCLVSDSSSQSVFHCAERLPQCETPLIHEPVYKQFSPVGNPPNILFSNAKENDFPDDLELDFDLC